MKTVKRVALATAAIFAALSTSAMAGPLYTFSTSVGTQPADVGTITLTQGDANSVIVNLDLLPTYGLLNTGGPHTPFAFNLTGSGTLSVAFSTPAGGVAPKGNFSLNTAGGSNSPYGAYGVAIDYSAGNGSGKAYYGDFAFTLTRAGGLDTNDFIVNDDGYYFSADLTNGTNTGAQAWGTRSGPEITVLTETTPVPEPLTIALFSAGLAGIGTMSRRRRLQKA